MSCDLQDKWSSAHVKTVRIAAYEDASRLLDWEDDTQSNYSEMVGFVERSLEVLFQTQTSKNRTLQKEEIHVNVSRGGGLTWQGALHYSM